MFFKRRIKGKIFKLPYSGFGINSSERVIEIPWALSVYGGEERVLEVGYAHAESEYINGLENLGCRELYAIDMTERDVAGLIRKKGDIRKTDFESGFFDLIFCISTIEHVGRDNSIYSIEGQIDEEGDFKAILELRRILKNRGKLVVTVPYGKRVDYGWFIQYDEERWRRLKRVSGLETLKEDYFIYRKGWFYCDKEDLVNIGYKDNNAPAACGLVCALLVKN